MYVCMYVSVLNRDEKISIRENLQKILEIEFPVKCLEKEDDMSMNCIICYSFRMEDQTPDKVCGNDKCRKAFHPKCLLDWLRAAAGRQSFDTFFGSCPNCFEDISVKVV